MALPLDPPNVPGGPGHKPVDPKKRRKQMLILGAVVVVTVLALLTRAKGKAPAPAGDPTQQPDPTKPVPEPKPDGAGSGVDNAGQLASFESALLDQLPQTISSALQAGFANGVPGASGASPNNDALLAAILAGGRGGPEGPAGPPGPPGRSVPMGHGHAAKKAGGTRHGGHVTPHPHPAAHHRAPTPRPVHHPTPRPAHHPAHIHHKRRR